MIEREAAAAEALAERLALGAFPTIPEPARVRAVRFWDERARALYRLHDQLYAEKFPADDAPAPARAAAVVGANFHPDPGKPAWAKRLTDDEARDPRNRT